MVRDPVHLLPLLLLLALLAGGGQAHYRGPSCYGGPVQAREGTDYSPCTAQRSGAPCIPRCAQGYRLAATATLECDPSTGRYHPGRAACTANPCTRPVGFLGEVDFSPCIGLTSGATCSPVCPPGLSPAVRSMRLQCGRDGTFQGRADYCVPNACSGGPVGGQEGVESFQLCSRMVSGMRCVPKCSAGYDRVPGASLLLVCSRQARYNVSSASAPRLCTPRDVSRSPNITDVVFALF